MPTASPDTQCNSHKADASHKPPTASESHYRLMIIVAAALSGSQRHKESEMERYQLSTDQLLRLKRVADYTGLQWRSLAARPARAKQMIDTYHDMTMGRTKAQFINLVNQLEASE
jgi:hypothetical protein